MAKTTRTKSSQRWLKEHFDDPYVKQAQQAGYRSRAVFKLKEIQEKDRLIQPGMHVVDLGAAPGGWSQIAVQWVGRKGKIYALDILPMQPLDDVDFIQGDFSDIAVEEALLAALDGKKIDVVLCDIAPNMSGIDVIDQLQSLDLIEIAFEFACKVLKPNGCFLVKIFQGEGFDTYMKNLRQHFEKVVSRKPDASRGRSRELYLLAKGFKGLA